MANEDCPVRTEENGSEPSEELCLKIPNEEPEANSPAQTDESEQNSLPKKQKQSSTKITIKLHAVGKAPILKNKKWVLERSNNLGHVSSKVRNMLQLKSSESLFLYVDQFSPPLDTIISNLLDCYGIEGVLNISYCTDQAYG